VVKKNAFSTRTWDMGPLLNISYIIYCAVSIPPAPSPSSSFIAIDAYSIARDIMYMCGQTSCGVVCDVCDTQELRFVAMLACAHYAHMCWCWLVPPYVYIHIHIHTTYICGVPQPPAAASRSLSLPPLLSTDQRSLATPPTVAPQTSRPIAGRRASEKTTPPGASTSAYVVCTQHAAVRSTQHRNRSCAPLP